MLLLAFDTASPDCAVALARASGGDLEILAEATERLGRGHAERLMPLIEATLQRCGTGFGELDRIVVTTGPGSFTGVRVGVAAARGLAFALQIPAVGIGSLTALAAELARSHGDGTAIAVLDAKRGEIYWLAQEIGSGAVLAGPAVVAVGSFAAWAAGFRRPLVLTGSGAALVAPVLDDAASQVVGMAEAPAIATVARLGMAAEGPMPVPLYLRGADAKPQSHRAVARL